MASDRQIAANRRNSLKSTGPRGPGGKARAAANSRKHGLASNLSRDAMAFAAADRLADAIFQTHGGLSRAAARRVAVATFELKNVQKMRAAAMEAVMSANESSTLSEQLEGLLLNLKTIDRYEVRAISKQKRALRGA